MSKETALLELIINSSRFNKEIMTVTAFGYYDQNKYDFYDFISAFLPSS